MNRILVAASHTPSPTVNTHSVPAPILRGACERITIETRSDKGMRSQEVALPHVLDDSVKSLRVLAMSSPAIIVMETQRVST